MNEITYHLIDLPLTRLHYLKCGHGKPLVILPATISAIDNWLNLVQFLAQKFTVYFFELPGHGQSKAFISTYKSDLVARTVEDFLDKLGISRFYLMGFSFGGILTIKTLLRLGERVENIMCFAPCVSYKAVRYSPVRFNMLRQLARFSTGKSAQKSYLKIMHNKRTVDLMILLLKKLGHVEKDENLKNKLLSLPEKTLEVLTYQVNEILTTDFEQLGIVIPQKCLFGMSINDPLLDYDVTKRIMRKLFRDIRVKEFDFPFHQPPEPFTVEYLQQHFGYLLKEV